MDFKTEAGRQGRQPFSTVELQLDFCTHVFGQSPCAAVNSVGMECYNTFASCQDTENFAKTTKSRFFSDVLLRGKNHLALIASIDTAPTKITPGKGLAARATASVVLDDTLSDDIDEDPYVANREYVAKERGTYWGKFLARNPHYYRRKMIIRHGFIGENGELDYTESYTYLIDSMSYDNVRRRMTIKGKDVLMLSDALKGKTPRASTGKLSAAINETATSLVIATDDDTQYDSPAGRIFANEEIIEYTGTSFDASGNLLTVTGLTRGAQGTDAAEHGAGDTMQRVRYWDAVRVDQALRDILETDAGIPAEFIPFDDWQTEADTWLGAFVVSTNIVKPKEINKLVSEIVEHCGLAIWSADRENAEIKMRVEAPLIGEELTNVLTLTDSDLIEDTLRITDKPELRISDVWFSHSEINPARESERQTNFAETEALFDADSFSEFAYNRRQTKELYTRWLRVDSLVQTISNRMLRRFKDTPKEIQFEIDASGPDLRTGQHFFLESGQLQGLSGAPQKTEFQVTSIDYLHKKERYRVVALQFRFKNERNAFISANGTPNYDSASDAQRLIGGFIAGPVNQTMDDTPTGDDPYSVI